MEVCSGTNVGIGAERVVGSAGGWGVAGGDTLRSVIVRVRIHRMTKLRQIREPAPGECHVALSVV
jgi:hypothetical protein